MTSSPTEVFEQIACALTADHPDLHRNARGSLVAGGTVRAMTSRGLVVVRLDPDRAAQVRASGEGSAYKGQPNRWVELRSDLDEARSAALVAEASGLRHVEG